MRIISGVMKRQVKFICRVKRKQVLYMEQKKALKLNKIKDIKKCYIESKTNLNRG